MPLAGAAAAVLLWMVVPASGPERQSARLENRVSPDSSKPVQSPATGAESAEPRPLVVAARTLRRWRCRGPSEEKARAGVCQPAGRSTGEQLERQLAEPAQRKKEAARRAEADQLAKVEDRAAPDAGVTPATPPRCRNPSSSRKRIGPPRLPRSGALASGLRHDGRDATVGVGGWRPDGPALAGSRGALAPCRTRHRRAQHERWRVLGAARHRRANAAQRPAPVRQRRRVGWLATQASCCSRPTRGMAAT